MESLSARAAFPCFDEPDFKVGAVHQMPVAANSNKLLLLHCMTAGVVRCCRTSWRSTTQTAFMPCILFQTFYTHQPLTSLPVTGSLESQPDCARGADSHSQHAGDQCDPCWHARHGQAPVRDVAPILNLPGGLGDRKHVSCGGLGALAIPRPASPASSDLRNSPEVSHVSACCPGLCRCADSPMCLAAQPLNAKSQQRMSQWCC